MKKTIALFFFVILFLFACFMSQINRYLQSGDVELKKVEIIKVIDGDTIVVNLDNTSTKIRMIGIDTPESNTVEGEYASLYTKSQLWSGRYVYLEFDEQRQDKYGRTLAYIWLTDLVDTTDFDAFKKYNFEAMLLQNTFCKPLCYSPNDKYADWYDRLNPNNY